MFSSPKKIKKKLNQLAFRALTKAKAYGKILSNMLRIQFIKKAKKNSS